MRKRFCASVEDGIAVINGIRVRIPGLSVMSVLGSGANGIVFETRDLELRRGTALKVYPVQPQDRRNKIQQGRAGARKIASLNHPGIAQVYRAGILPDGSQWFYVAMELVAGTTLKTLLASEQLAFNDCLSIWRDIVDAVRYAHCKRIYHGDLHPGNIIIGVDGYVKIIDFGTSVFAIKLCSARLP